MFSAVEAKRRDFFLRQTPLQIDHHGAVVHRDRYPCPGHRGIRALRGCGPVPREQLGDDAPHAGQGGAASGRPRAAARGFPPSVIPVLRTALAKGADARVCRSESGTSPTRCGRRERRRSRPCPCPVWALIRLLPLPAPPIPVPPTAAPPAPPATARLYRPSRRRSTRS